MLKKWWLTILMFVAFGFVFGDLIIDKPGRSAQVQKLTHDRDLSSLPMKEQLQKMPANSFIVMKSGAVLLARSINGDLIDVLPAIGERWEWRVFSDVSGIAGISTYDTGQQYEALAGKFCAGKLSAEKK